MQNILFHFLNCNRLTLQLFCCTLFIFQIQSFAQTHTVGLIENDPEKVMAGYTLIYPHNQGTVFLVNTCGELVHQWRDTLFLPGNSARLMKDGSIFITKGHGDFTNPWIKGGGGGMKIEHRDWDNNLIWEFTYNDSLKRMHHDFTVLPNGNVILIAWEVKSYSELIAAGRDTNLLNDCKLWVDHLIEVKPIGKDSGTIVWQWHAFDHLIQDHDSTKSNFGVVADHPELINLNYYFLSGFSDWLHMNSVDYNPTLDMLLVSSPVCSEVWMIDHSTTTSQAASHKGGKCGMGGDLVFRWGNPQVYAQGGSEIRRIGYQHDAHWMDIELPTSDPDFGKIMLFSNKTEFNRSSIVVINPVYNSQTHRFQMKDGRFLPENVEHDFCTTDPARIFSETSSSAQLLPNGNLFICSGRSGHLFEMDTSGNIFWEYIIPLNMGKSVSQGDVVPLSANITFRCKKYSTSFPAFVGRDLRPIGFIEKNPDTLFCDSGKQKSAIGYFSHFSCELNPSMEKIEIAGMEEQKNYSITIFNADGIPIENFISKGELKASIDFNNELPGLYFIEIHTESESYCRKLVKLY